VVLESTATSLKSTAAKADLAVTILDSVVAKLDSISTVASPI
jgi:hypothetical protein